MRKHGSVSLSLYHCITAGCAYYDWASPIVNISVAFPPFERMERVVYLPETDTLFVAGFTPAESDWDNVWGAVGRVIQSECCRFDESS